ncbi:MAG: DUF4105 domain-containing protein, partial [Proteobacteria bacterium]
FVAEANAPVRLFPQSPRQEANYKEPILVYDYAISAIGLRPMSLKGSLFDWKKGMNGTYGQGIGITSMYDIWYYDSKPLGRDLLQYRLKLDNKRKGDLLAFYIRRSDEIRETLSYHSIYENCITELFLGFFEVARLRKGIFDDTIVNARGRHQYLPFGTLGQLESLDLMNSREESRVPAYSLEAESGIIPEPLQTIEDRN